MQRLITVGIDTKQLLKTAGNPFIINDVDSVNELLEQGWEIEEWDFLVEDTGDGQLLLMVTLNDDAMFDDDDENFGEFELDEDEEEFEEDDKVKRL